MLDVKYVFHFPYSLKNFYCTKYVVSYVSVALRCALRSLRSVYYPIFTETGMC
jgi:hypothetical protein